MMRSKQIAVAEYGFLRKLVYSMENGHRKDVHFSCYYVRMSKAQIDLMENITPNKKRDSYMNAYTFLHCQRNLCYNHQRCY